MFGWDKIAATFCLIIGLSLLAGFVSQFRERGYVGWLGATFLTLSAAAFLSQISGRASRIALAIAGLLFLFAFISAFLQTRRNLEAIKRRHLAAQEQLLAMVEAERDRREKAAGDEPQDQEKS